MNKLRRTVFIGSVAVGGGHPVSIQSMCNTRTSDADATLGQIKRLAAAGCEIIRVAVPDMAAAEALTAITAASPLPVVADIHFDWRLAVAALEHGAAAIRVNPGNLGGAEPLARVAEALKRHPAPVRVGANSGSLPKVWQEKLHHARREEFDELLSDALVASALEQARALEELGIHDIKVSLKASNVPATVLAYRKFAAAADYPLHVGVTEAGTPARGVIKSAVGIGALLLDGIGDTIRVSLTADPEQEVAAARRILESVGLRDAEPDIVSCPTCGRTKIDLIALAEKVENLVASLKKSGKRIALRKIAVMGCVVNGPGEAREAELGIAGGDGKVVLFRYGEVTGTYPEEEGFARLEAEIRKHLQDAG